MTTITCDKKKFQRMLEFMTIGGLLPQVGLNVFTDGSVRCVQFDKNSSCGAKVIAVGFFEGFNSGEENMEKMSIAMNAEKVLEYLKTLKGDDVLQIEVQEAYLIFRSGGKKITTDRLDVKTLDTYVEKPPFNMDMKNFLPLYKKGTIETSTHCYVESNVLRDMVKDTKAVDQKQYKMSFESPNVLKYEARGSNSKRGNDSIEALITDAIVEGDSVEAIVSAAIPEIADLFGGAVEIHIAHEEKDVFPIWFKMIDDWMKIGYFIPTIDLSVEE